MSRLKIKLVVYLIRHHPQFYFKKKKLLGLCYVEDRDFWLLHAQLIEDGKAVQDFEERYNLWNLARATARLPGDLAEVGVYQGGTAKILAEVKGEASLFLFDTFTGMPPVNKATDGAFNQGDFANTSLEEVKRYLSAYPNVFFYPGKFPESVAGQNLEERRYKFVHLDVDIYESTLKCLEYFYPKMVAGGVIVSHDYNRIEAPGVRRAFTEFMADKPETLIPLWRTQVALMKA